MRRIQDYKALIRSESQSLGSASPFNISAESLTLRNFTLDEVKALYGQHTEATGQRFEDGVYDEVMKYTGGQPWLVNAIARECVEKIHNFNYDEPITVEDVVMAKEAIIRRRDSNILSLLSYLEKDVVRDLAETTITGKCVGSRHDMFDYEYLCDLGVLKQDGEFSFSISNKMYEEVIVDYLASYKKYNNADRGDQ